MTFTSSPCLNGTPFTVTLPSPETVVSTRWAIIARKVYWSIQPPGAGHVAPGFPALRGEWACPLFPVNARPRACEGPRRAGGASAADGLRRRDPSLRSCEQHRTAWQSQHLREVHPGPAFVRAKAHATLPDANQRRAQGGPPGGLGPGKTTRSEVKHLGEACGRLRAGGLLRRGPSLRSCEQHRTAWQFQHLPEVSDQAKQRVAR
jgi:hypothetical protein